ncbi:MAG: stimulus-sensing domain-containing protein [Hyphomicrobiales bacterium]
MALESAGSHEGAEETGLLSRARQRLARLGQGASRLGRRFERSFPFSSLTQLIVILNLVGLATLVAGILFMNQFRAGLIDAKVQSLLTQGEIIAGAIASTASVEASRMVLDPEPGLDRESFGPGDDALSGLQFSINPERIAPELRGLIRPTGTRARIYDREGALLLDSDALYTSGRVVRLDPAPAAEPPATFLETVWNTIAGWLFQHNLPVYKDIGGENGKAYPEVASALTGTSVPIVRVTEKGELVVSVAVPIQRLRAVLGVLLLSTRGGEIDAIVTAERWGIIRVAAFAATVTIVLAVLMARTIAGPMRRLSSAARRVRRSITARAEIPDYTHRSDEIGQLSGALREMTSALYRRLDAIESFAADVSHELKNPLTSLRSAAEALPRVQSEEARTQLMDIIQHDVRRLDRLISDISDASRLDAELAREDAAPVNMADLLQTIVPAFNNIHRDTANTPVVQLSVETAGPANGKDAYFVIGHDIRLGQVMTNLLDNAISFSPQKGKVKVAARRLNGEVEITVEDDGPGIPDENLDRVFERFYTDRPGEESFGQNSGLGLNISQQIINAHGGRIWAENRKDRVAPRRGRVGGGRGPGARFVIRLPAA